MSRIGKRVINIPSDIEVKVDGTVIVFKKGKLEEKLDTCGRVGISLEKDELSFSPLDSVENSRAFWGTYRSLANNIVEGMNKGFQKSLEINGVGYRATVKGRVLELQLGFSHPINFDIPEGIDIAVEKNTLSIKGANKQQVGQIAADIRAYRPPEPYKGKGVKYSDERIIKKAGKTAKK